MYSATVVRVRIYGSDYEAEPLGDRLIGSTARVERRPEHSVFDTLPGHQSPSRNDWVRLEKEVHGEATVREVYEEDEC